MIPSSFSPSGECGCTLLHPLIQAHTLPPNSKRDCEAYAMQMSKLDFTTDDEKTLIGQVFANAIDSLSDDDKKLPQVCVHVCVFA